MKHDETSKNFRVQTFTPKKDWRYGHGPSWADPRVWILQHRHMLGAHWLQANYVLRCASQISKWLLTQKLCNWWVYSKTGLYGNKPLTIHGMLGGFTTSSHSPRRPCPVHGSLGPTSADRPPSRFLSNKEGDWTWNSMISGFKSRAFTWLHLPLTYLHMFCR